ncbi:MAG: arylamine N-acetyltransferase [Eubacteriales bacterium]
MDISQYLKRIGFDGPIVNDYETLKKLQFCHMTTVPYENLDILAGIPLKLDSESLYEKIVLAGRGGYCFELNGAFGALLRELGFDLTDCMARFLKNETQIPMRRHRVLQVRCADGLFLCDVGVGMINPIYPVRLDADAVQVIGNEQYKITKDDFLGTVLHQCFEGVWDRFFAFTDEPQLDIDFIMPSFYCEKHPDSPFIKADMLAIQTRFGGKHSISGDTLTYWDESGKHKVTIENEEMRKEALEKYFGIVTE